jgi:hypothetical protein
VNRILLRTTDPEAATSLFAALGATECLTERVDEQTIVVALPKRIDDGQLGVELRFFVRAWQLHHQNASVAFSVAA